MKAVFREREVEVGSERKSVGGLYKQGGRGKQGLEGRCKERVVAKSIEIPHVFKIGFFLLILERAKWQVGGEWTEERESVRVCWCV